MKSKDTKENSIEEIPTFLMNDQPTVCSICGSRCDDLANFMHTNAHTLLMQCLNPECLFIFFEDEDEEFLTLWE